MIGTVNISRGLFHSDAFRNEIFTEREAWIWLVMEASWKDRTVRAGDYLVDTKRGQLAASIRFMAKAWKWTPAKAQRFLKRVEKLKMIRSKTDTGVSVLTICKYEEYQNGAQATDTGPIQDRYRTDTNEKKYVIREEGKEDYISVKNRFSEFWDSVPRKVGKDAAKTAFAKATKSTDPDIIIAGMKRYAAERSGEDQKFTKHPGPWLNAGRWDDEPPAPHTKPNGRTDGHDRLNAAMRAAERVGREMDRGSGRNPAIPLFPAGSADTGNRGRDG